MILHILVASLNSIWLTFPFFEEMVWGLFITKKTHFSFAPVWFKIQVGGFNDLIKCKIKFKASTQPNILGIWKIHLSKINGRVVIYII